MKQKLTTSTTDSLLETSQTFSGESLKRLFQWVMILKIWSLECFNWILMQDILLMRFSFIHGCKARHPQMKRFWKSLMQDQFQCIRQDQILRKRQEVPRIDRGIVFIFAGCWFLLILPHLSTPQLLPYLYTTLKTPQFFLTL